MKVLYDHQVFSWQKVGGISRYFIELMQNLPCDINFNLSIKLSDNIYLKSNKIDKKSFSLPDFRGKLRIYDFLNSLNSEYLLRENKYDLLHPTYYNPYFLKYNKKPYVITVHDMIHEKFSHMFKPNDPMKEFKKSSILGAEKIIAISENTKKDIIELYGINENKISVIYHGYSISKNIVEPLYGLPEKYILYVGEREQYKNFDRFIKATSLLSKEYPDLHVVCTGRNFKPEELIQIKKLSLDKKIHHYFVTDSQLSFLYQNAECFVFPSLYEGFGMPILESFASGCPIVLSDTSCFPEIAKDGGCYFNPYEIDSIVSSIRKVLSNQDYKRNLISNGYKILETFSIKKMALETSNLYRSI